MFGGMGWWDVVFGISDFESRDIGGWCGWMGDGIHVERWLWCFGDLFVGVVDRWVGLCTERVYLLVFRIGRDDLI